MTESPSYHPAQKMELKERAKDADEFSLSRFIIKFLKKHGLSHLLFLTIFFGKFFHSKILGKRRKLLESLLSKSF